jgi:hypothetical protein
MNSGLSAQLLCDSSTYIYFDVQSRVTFCDLALYAGGVPAEHLETLHDEIRKALKNIAESGIEMDRMAMVLKRERRKVVFKRSCRCWRLNPFLLL